jgi:hypothetical protein
MDRTKTDLGRRRFLTITGAASTLVLTASAAKAVEKAASGGCGATAGKTIRGVVVEKPVHPPYRIPSFEEAKALGLFPDGGAGGMPPKPAKLPVPAVYVDDSKYVADKSQTDAATGGKITDKFASGVKITGKSSDVGGVYVKGIGTEYILADATIDLTGDGKDQGGTGVGAAVDDYATLVIRNSKITTNGKSRNATSAENFSTLKVYNSTLTSNGVPFTPDINSNPQKKQLEIDGNTRTHCTLSGSYSYFYYSTIITEGWGALSTDGANGFVYLEADHCTIRTKNSGYGAYADEGCHDVFNSCEFDVASMATIVAGEADATFNDVKAKCGSHFVLIHCVTGSPAEMGGLKVIGGEIKTKTSAVRVKSANAEIVLDNAKVVTENGVLLESTVSTDPNAVNSANVKGKNVYGIHATFKNMDATGDVIHSDKENRKMTVYLESAVLKGAVKDASIKLDRHSKWTATADSDVTIIGDIDLSQIDAPAGVTITAIAGESGKYKLASCGTLILKAS